MKGLLKKGRKGRKKEKKRGSCIKEKHDENRKCSSRELIRMKPVFLVLVLSSLLGLAQMNTVGSHHKC